ncbi:hypothetical protein ACROYT_G005354 [Oculina patagonica]
MIMRLQKYDLEVQYEKGKNMYIADFLSQVYLPNTEHPTGANFEHVNMASILPISDQWLQEIRKEMEKDETLQILKSVILPDRGKGLESTFSHYFDNKDFIITVKYFMISNYWEINKLNNTLAITVVLKLKSHFARYRCPEQVVSDNGPQFDSEVFRKFANTWDFEHTPNKITITASNFVDNASGLCR